MSSRYDEIRGLIESHPEVVEFADFGNGVSEEWIQKAEAALGFRLPPSYRWWLANYGGGEIGGEEVFSVYEQDFDEVVGGDIVYMHRLNSEQGLVGAQQLSICESDIDGVFVFDRSQCNPDGEFPVISLATSSVYAADFIEFLKKRIETYTG